MSMMLLAIIWLVVFMVWFLLGWRPSPAAPDGWVYGRHGMEAFLIGALGWMAFHGILH